jgi:DNA repair protein RadC
MKFYEARTSYDLVCECPAHKWACAEVVVANMRDAFARTPEQESFWVISLNRKNRMIARTMISIGTATSCLVHPREVFRAAIRNAGTAIVVAHNHPSGDPAPSPQDMQITRVLRDSAKIIDIQLVDHVIVGDVLEDPLGRGYFSFRDAGVL